MRSGRVSGERVQGTVACWSGHETSFYHGNIFLRPRHGLLREVVDRAKLQQYVSTYGDVTELWSPWSAEDRGCFGIATYKKPDAAMQA